MSISSIKDENLVSSYITGDNNSLNILINRHQTKILSFVISKVRDRSVAQDIVQETFLKVIKTLKKGNYNEQGKFLPWVMRIAHNLSIDFFRKKSKIKFIRSTDDFNIFNIIKDTDSSCEDKVVQQKIFQDIKKLIHHLPVNQRKVLEMRYYSSMSFNEIAENCNISINTALGRMRYALINLRKIIKKDGVVLSVD